MTLSCHFLIQHCNGISASNKITEKDEEERVGWRG
jgi:hypothetical protein